MQRLQIAWSDCIWTPKVLRVSQVRSARPFFVRHSTNIRDRVTKLYSGAVMPFFRIIRLKFGRRSGCLWAISLMEEQ